MSFIVIKQNKTKRTKKKKHVVAWCLYKMCSLLYWLVFTHPALFKRNWAIITTDTRKLRIVEEFFESSLDTYACFPLANTPRLSAPLCLPKHAVRSACKGLNSASLLLDYWHINIYMESLHPNSVVKKNVILVVRWIMWKCSWSYSSHTTRRRF